ncbi:growth hormone secretagogue receptor type 1-like [Physella acuta]|uniref:growth hormone secretagogue receptor type 1-like n=1 Tax=Physella acuta TaxID=109671 RepID=UPI0027DB965C|nr:growth hormone secretagogue receptor type 1-like [Physella acuta]
MMADDKQECNCSTATSASAKLPSESSFLYGNICDDLENVTDLEVKVTCGTDLYLPPFLFALGIVSNVFVVLVMRGAAFRSLSTSFYMMVNAVTDGASLLVNLPAHYLYVNFHTLFRGVRAGNYMCAFFNVFGWGTSDLGILFTVAMTTERAIAIKYPLKAPSLCTPRRAKFVVLGLTVFELVKLTHMAFRSVVAVNTTTHLCDVDLGDPKFAFYAQEIFPWFHACVLIVCYTTTIVGNVVIVRNIRKSNTGKSTEGLGRKIFTKPSSQNRQLSIMLVVDSSCLIVCTLPYALFNILQRQFALLPDGAGGKNLTATASFYLLYVNRCLNFFLYCVSGSRFRQEIKNLFLRSPLTSSRLNLARSQNGFNSSESGSRRSNGSNFANNPAIVSSPDPPVPQAGPSYIQSETPLHPDKLITCSESEGERCLDQAHDNLAFTSDTLSIPAVHKNDEISVKSSTHTNQIYSIT